MHTVSTSDGNQLECAIIHGRKNERIDNEDSVLICNPNGAYLQYFGIESSYINFYLDKKLKIILWNYRGYGCSTGIPSISNSIKDAQTIY